MPVLRKRASQSKDRFVQNGLYVHASPPRVLSLSSANIRQIVRSGDIDKLENVVLEGQGKKLIGEYSPNFRVRVFIKSIPQLMSKISLLHDAVNSGRLEELQSILEEEDEKTKKKLVLAKDEAGVGLLHKAVYYDLRPIIKWLADKFPQTAVSKDTDGRTPYHYTPMCKDPASVQKMLTKAGADPHGLDNNQHTAKYYMDNYADLELPSSHKVVSSSRKSTANRDSNGSVIKKSNIRIWIHHRDLNNLQQVIWEGQGQRLLVEHSNNHRVKRFLEAVPHIMGLIKGIHLDVVNDDLDSLKKRTQPPIPAVVLTGKDVNGMTALHKAVGLGRQEMAEYIIATCPKTLNLTDNEGRTALHYATLVKDGGSLFDRLIDAGADESHLDNKQKTAAFYKTRTNELDTKLLHTIPECPRIAKESFLSTFDWSLLGSNAAITPGDTEQKDMATELEAQQEENGVEDTNGHSAEENGNGAGEEEVTQADDVFGEAEESTTEAETEAAPEPDAEAEDEPEAVEAEIEAEVVAEVEAEPESQPEETDEEAPAEAETEPEADEAKADEEPEEEPTEAEPTDEPEATEDPSAPEVEEDPVEATEVVDLNEIPRTDDIDEGITVAEDEPEPEEEPEPEPEEEREPDAEDNEVIELENDEETIPDDGIDEGEIIKTTETEIDEIEGVIEGVVNGENEIESVNEEGQGSADSGDEEVDVAALIESGNMEQLASLVLNGDGDKLVGQHSDIPELQSFLENVPTYMTKINKIHTAARAGGLKELQAALDRRKFAIARDKISPNGATPLHVSTIFGNTSIVRYLAGRFPETIAAVDFDGRSPLHYAAVITDNGHYYNLLVHLGANTRAEDKYGHTPEFYKSNQGSLSHRSLLRDFGAEEMIADEMLQDKDNVVSSQVEMPFFCTEEGRYLASSLGDPLIKGLTEVANIRPEDPIAYLAQYLYNFANHNRSRTPRNLSITQAPEIITNGHPEHIENNNNEVEPAVEVPATIDVVTVEPNDDNPEDESAFNPTSRDEHGQSMLHFAAARSHGRNALYQLLLETEINIGYRDELYRTARDISIQANVSENTIEIDRYVLQISTKGDTDKLVELLLDGYDHIIDIVDEEGIPIIDAVANAAQPDTVAFINSILAFEERRERVHHSIREGNLNEVTTMLADENDTGSGKLLAIGKNSYGRCALHIAVLCQQEEIVDFLANTFVDSLRIGDNLERTALHYAMGVEKIETISRVLIKAGAKRVVKDLKGRQPTYYFMNKSDILRLQEEEETF